MKNGLYSEINALKKFDNIFVEQYGAGQFVKGNLLMQREPNAGKGINGYAASLKPDNMILLSLRRPMSLVYAVYFQRKTYYI
jgi:hypothetical protein